MLRVVAFGNLAVWTGSIAAVLAILEAVRRLCVGCFQVARSLVRFADAVPTLLDMASERAEHGDQLAALAADFAQHTSDDRVFQEWIMSKLEQGAGSATESRGSS